MLLYQAKLSQT